MVFKPGNPGRKQGSKNRKTIALERVYQRCDSKDFHPVDVIIELALCAEDDDTRLDAAKTLLSYIEGKQPDGKPLTPELPSDSVENAKAMMDELAALSSPLEPKA